MVVYCCLNRATGKVYIGKTTAPLRRRWSEHKAAARRGSSYLIHRAIRKYGPDTFEVSVLATAQSLEELNALESHYITELGALVPGGYNLRTGGEGGSHSESTRQLIREKALGRRWKPEAIERMRVSMTGVNGPFFGRHHTEETKQVLREKCADVTRGISKSEGHRAAISRGLMGKAKSLTHRQHMGDARRGKSLTEEHKQNIGRAGKGVPKPEGFAAKVSAAQKGRPKSEEAKQRMREAALQRYRKEPA